MRWLFPLLLFCFSVTNAQDSATDSVEGTSTLSKHSSRQWVVGGLTVAGYGGSFLFLSQAWYNDYPRRSFHTFNDAGEWQQVDKIGHSWTAYQTSRLSTEAWRWAGVKGKKGVLLGAGSSLLYMLSIEYLDGHSTEWGWSWTDVGSNFLGATLFAAQDRGWSEQRIGFKFSAHAKDYGQPDLQHRADKLFGTSFQGRLLKDYNAQTYWLSANLRSFFPKTTMPAWLNLSVGYGADGMYGGYENIARDKSGTITFDRRDIKRFRRWYLAPDVDLTRIKTKSRFLKTVLTAVNVLKFPAPALEFASGRFRLKAIAY